MNRDELIRKYNNFLNEQIRLKEQLVNKTNVCQIALLDQNINIFK